MLLITNAFIRFIIAAFAEMCHFTVKNFIYIWGCWKVMIYYAGVYSSQPSVSLHVVCCCTPVFTQFYGLLQSVYVQTICIDSCEVNLYHFAAVNIKPKTELYLIYLTVGIWMCTWGGACCFPCGVVVSLLLVHIGFFTCGAVAGHSMQV